MTRREVHRNSVNSNPYRAFLKPLIGKIVKVYRGGPESREGQLLDVQSDYVALLSTQQNGQNQQNEQNQQNNSTVVYYNLGHVQSISENSKVNSMQQMSENNQQVEFVSAYNFRELLKKLINNTIKVNQGGPESKVGWLINVVDDYIIVLTEDDGVVFYNISHVKSVSVQNNNSNENMENFAYFDYVNVKNFRDLFSQFSHRWVSINRGGPEALEGVLVQGVGGHYTLVNNDEVIRINPYHIKSISCGPKGSLKQNQQNNTQNKQNQENEAQSEMTTNEFVNTRQESEARSYRRSYQREKVIRTIDYVWNPKR
jgi:spore coat protein B